MTYKFTKEQEQWLQALESGNFSQTRNALWKILDYKETGYCCLGVACKLFDPNAFEMIPSEYDSYKRSEGVVASDNVVKFLNLRSRTGRLRCESGRYTSLADMNDAGLTFEKIAEYIRKNPENVFVRGNEDAE